MMRQTLRNQNDPASDIVAGGHMRRRLRIGLLLTMVFAMLVTSSVATLAGKSSDGFIVKDDRQESMLMIRPLATLELANGDEVIFTPLPGKRGETDGVLVSGVRSDGRIPTSAVEGLRDANPLELFVALSEPGDEIPPILRELYGKHSTVGDQGWARDLAIATDPQYVSCPAVYWGDQLDDFADAFNHDDPFSSTWDGPNTMPGHWAYIGSPPADGKPYYELNGQANDVTAFYGSVLYCVEDAENASIYNGQYVGNYVTSTFRQAGTGTWYFSGQTQLEDVGDIYEHIYNPGGKFSPGASKYDFHMEIYMAKPADQFHIGATWVYGGPTDITSGS